MGSQNKRAMRVLSQVQWRQRRGNLFALRTLARRNRKVTEPAETAEAAELDVTASEALQKPGE